MSELTVDFNNKIRERLPARGCFTSNELTNLLKRHYPELKKSTLYWKISELKRKGLITPVKKGIYMLTESKKVYEPIVSDLQGQISNIISNSYDDIVFCSWNSNWLNDFSIHQAYNNILLVNIERDLVKSVFHMLQDKGVKNLYLTPDNNVIDNYISEVEEAVVIIPLITKSPVIELSGVPAPVLEKILVDTFCDDKLLTAYSGGELKTIFENAFEEFVVDISKMINYSRRRKRENRLKEFLISNNILAEDILLHNKVVLGLLH
ncbi:MAG: DUF6577 family protein [Candidatus Cloacimonadia bacterium]